MTTEQLRKEITVNYYHITNAGIYVVYFYALKNEIRYLHLNPEECARKLSAIDSIDSWNADSDSNLLLYWDGHEWIWADFYLNFKLSQWEALTLAIRHEYELSLEQDSSMMYLTNSINKLNQLK